MLFSRSFAAIALSALADTTNQPFSAEACKGPLSTRSGADFPALLDADLSELVAGLESGLFASVDLVAAYTARIREVNDTLHAVAELNPDAPSIAAEADEARARGEVLGPLHGIPILLKNNIATADAMGNTAGSHALAGAEVSEDSTVAAKLRKAGAVILGKANLSQWANCRSLNSSNGWSAYGGLTTGAYYPQQDPSGSSSGSGVAASLGLAFAALGTETSGSIISPSSANNVVGIKPSVGLTSRHLVIPISEHQDTVGPMARTVKDAAYVLAAIAGPDPNDNYTSAIPFETIPDYVAACDYDALKGKRIGVPRNMLADAEPGGTWITAFNESLEVFREAGAEVVDDVYIEGWDWVYNKNAFMDIALPDFARNLGEYFAKLSVNPRDITSLSDLLEFTQGSELEEWPARDTVRFEDGIRLEMQEVTAEWWERYQDYIYHVGELGLTGALRNHSLDALIHLSPFASAIPATLGSPMVSVPLGREPDDTPLQRNRFEDLYSMSPNYPFGISFLGERFSEERLIGLAYAFEQRTMVRREVVPYIQPTTELEDVVGKGECELE